MIYEKHGRYIIPFDDVPSQRAVMPEISVEERKGNFVEVETGFPEEMAVNEAKRCLGCRRCLGCALCWAECKPEAIDFSMPDETLDLEFDEVIITPAQDNTFERLDKALGYGIYPHVITDLQFERMLSPTGPTDGLVMSPLNGQIPSRLAIIQGHPEEDENHLLPSLILGVNESILALHKTEELEVTLVSPFSDTFEKDYLPEAKKVKGLELVNGKPLSVKQETDGLGLLLTYTGTDGEKQQEFDMIVVLTKPKLSSDISNLSKKLNQEVVSA
ncbi:MAG TPA: hypothetical protein ENF92_06915 [Desulfobacteraceae bacterium]|nr:hypothetical protein [Deltaproteobacteria bacterium]HDM10229.1 hypothetical protein [Desulfobacteraceae bacterium]